MLVLVGHTAEPSVGSLSPAITVPGIPTCCSRPVDTYFGSKVPLALLNRLCTGDEGPITLNTGRDYGRMSPGSWDPIAMLMRAIAVGAVIETEVLWACRTTLLPPG